MKDYMRDYTMEYRTPQSPVTYNGDRVTQPFKAKNDIEAVEKAKRLFLGEVEGAFINPLSILTQVYRTPRNLLEKSVGVEIKRGENMYLLIKG